jgi:predicted short-subunit dehydrogenase-like oxidoreductase (DUF2520 family)
VNHPDPPEYPLSIALIGAGRVGTAVAQLLNERGHRIAGVWSRTPESAIRAAEFLGAGTFQLDSGVPHCDLALIGTSDPFIAPVAARISPALEPGAVACHFAGSLGLGPLKAVLESGAHACALHPVQAVPDVAAGVARLPGSAWGVTCSEGMSAWARELVAGELSGTPIDVPEVARPLWHAASVTTSNGIAALFATGEAMLGTIGVDDPPAVLAPLAAGTVANAAERGGGAALTGPVVRGEGPTVERHLEALRDAAPDLVPLYALVAELVLRAARRAGRVDRDVERSIGALLRTP